MKTTIEIDEIRLGRVMKLTGMKTRRAAVDYALAEAEKAAKMRALFEKPLPAEAYRTAVAPGYDVRAAREAEGRGRVAR